MTYISSFKDQNWLLPPSIKQMIPQDHICFFVEEFVESLDFEGFDEINEGVGHPSYHPRILMKILLQGMLSRERSSRRLAQASYENVVFIYLAEKMNPNFRTICRFRRQNALFIKEAFKETISLASAHDLIDLSLICTDGSKVKANANNKSSLKREQLEQLDVLIDKIVDEDIKQDEIDKEIYGEEDKQRTNRDKKNLREIVKKYRKNKNKENFKDNFEKAKEEIKKDPNMQRVSMTDPECRMMQTKKQSYELSYNTQFTVDSKNQIIVANDVCQDRSDWNQLKPQIEQVKENIALKEETKVGADCGYSSGDNFKFLEDEKLEGFIPNQSKANEFEGKDQTQMQDNYEYDWDRNEIIIERVRLKYFSTRKRKGKPYSLIYKSEDNKIEKRVPIFFRERLRMRDKMKTDRAREIYDLRKIVVEPIIGNIKENLGFREFRLRGLENAKIELNIASIAHNLKKIWIAKGTLLYNNQKINFYFIFVIGFRGIMGQPVRLTFPQKILVMHNINKI
jgi:transposase